MTWFYNVAESRRPDVVIGGHTDPYLFRWFLIPRNPILNIYLHCFLRSDDDRAHHDHPWLFNISWLLAGMYDEHSIRRGGVLQVIRRVAGTLKLRLGPAPHRLELVEGKPCWTLFITGPRYRTWGFHCPSRWIPWRKFTAPEDPGKIGPGCDA